MISVNELQYLNWPYLPLKCVGSNFVSTGCLQHGFPLASPCSSGKIFRPVPLHREFCNIPFGNTLSLMAICSTTLTCLKHNSCRLPRHSKDNCFEERSKWDNANQWLSPVQTVQHVACNIMQHVACNMLHDIAWGVQTVQHVARNIGVQKDSGI